MSTDRQPESGLAGLKSPQEATNRHEAMGLWWAHATLRHAFKDGVADDPMATDLKDFAVEDSVARRSAIEETVGSFAAKLTSLL